MRVGAFNYEYHLSNYCIPRNTLGVIKDGRRSTHRNPGGDVSAKALSGNRAVKGEKRRTEAGFTSAPIRTCDEDNQGKGTTG